jgi:hypothetical protein
MKNFILPLLLCMHLPLLPYEFILTPEQTADGLGKFKVLNYYSGCARIATLRTPSIQFALRTMARKAHFLGIQAAFIGWDLKGSIFEETTPCFDTSDLWFRSIRGNLLANYCQYKFKQFTFLLPSGKIIGSGFIIGPQRTGIVDASTMIQTMVGSD